MKIKHLQTGVIQHLENNLGRTLIAAGLAEEIPPEKGQSSIDRLRQRQREYFAAQAAPALEPVWQVVTIKYDDGMTRRDVVAVRMDLGKQMAHYCGLPDNINSKLEWPGGCRYLNGFGREVPEEIAGEYRKQWKHNPDMRLPDEVLRPKRSDANDQMAAEKESFDRAVQEGKVPYSGNRV